MSAPRFETRTISGEICIGDTVTGEYRTLDTFLHGDAPADTADAETLAAEIVRNMHRLDRDGLPGNYWVRRRAFVYDDGSLA